MVIGGMMENSSANTDTGLPYAMSMPVLGNLFKSVNKANTLLQTVIFIKATIVPSDGANKKDRKFYNSFAVDEEVTI